MQYNDDDNNEEVNSEAESSSVDETSSESEATEETTSREAQSVVDKIKSSKRKRDLQDLAKTVRGKDFFATLAPILPYIVSIVAVLIVAIGLIMFFLTVPSALIRRAQEFVDGFRVEVASWIVGEENAKISDKEIANLASYLESMGYDLYEYGFINSESDITREEDGKIKKVNSGVLRAYLVSDNYVYLCKNFNKSFKGAFSSVENFLK